MSDFKDITALMDDAVRNFEKALPGVQNKALGAIIELTKDLETRNGKIINSVNNLKKIGTIKNRLQALTLSPGYKSSVKDFVGTFETISDMQHNYFKKYVPKFKPEKKLSIIKEYAVDQTIHDLVGQGMVSQVVEPVSKIIRDNITSGGSYAKFQQQLTDYIVDNGSGEGKLTRYTKQITTDAINQYNAQYHTTIAQDLGFQWGRYVGSDIETTREFCDWMTDRDYFHVSELPELLKGHIDGHECKLSKTTNLPLGMIPGTNTDNFKVRRGGYNCRHGVYMVPDSAVPKEVKDRLGKPLQAPTIGEKVAKANKGVMDEFKNLKINTHEDLLNKLGGEIKFKKSSRVEAHFNPNDQSIVIGNLGSRLKSEYLRETVLAHEIGHAIHNTRGIIAGNKISPEFEEHFTGLQSILKGKEAELDATLKTKYSSLKNSNDKEQLLVIADILGSLTRGKYGFGHSKEYYQRPTGGHVEVFANGVALSKVDNKFSDITDEVKQIVEKMVEYSNGL